MICNLINYKAAYVNELKVYTISIALNTVLRHLLDT